MATTIRVTYSVEAGGVNVLTELASAVLCSRDGTFGIRQKDTGSLLVAANTPLSHVGAGTYEFDYGSLPGFLSEAEYEFIVKLTRTDGMTYWAPGLISPPAPAEGEEEEPEESEFPSEYRMPLGDLVSYTRILLSDPEGERYSGLIIIEELNNALVEMGVDTRCVHDSVDIRLMKDVYEYDPGLEARAAGKRDLLLVERIEFNGGDSPSLLKTHQVEIDIGFGGMREGGTCNWSDDLVDPGKITLFMIPEKNGAVLPDLTDNIRVFFAAIPKYLGSVDGYPDPQIPPQFHQGLAYGAARNLLLEEKDSSLVKKAMEFDQAFNDWMMRTKSSTTIPRGGMREMMPL